MSIFCLVHAACLGAWAWDLVIPYLQAQGHKAIAMDLPIENPSATLSDFAEAVVRSLPPDENDVILVGTSMAGTVIPLVANQRPVRKLVFLAALIPYPGMNTIEQTYKDIPPDVVKAAGYEQPEASKLEQVRDEPEMFNPASLGKNFEDEAVAMEFFFHDCKPDVALWAISKMRNHLSSASITEVFPLPALPDVESVYIVCTEDRIISPTWSRYAARKRLGVDAIELSAGHCPYLSHPAQLAEILLTLC
jgi:pimeloyl-ACP methyl ester carboxylesterase